MDVDEGCALLVDVLNMDSAVELEHTMDGDAGVGRVSTIDVCEMDDVLSIVVVGMCSNVVTIKIFPVKYCVHNNFEDCVVYLWQMFLCQSTFYFPSLLLLFLFVDGLSFSFF